jgi:hypothetical protein
MVYCGAVDEKRDAKNPGPIYMTNPKDVRVAELEIELAQVREQANIETQDKRK